MLEKLKGRFKSLRKEYTAQGDTVAPPSTLSSPRISQSSTLLITHFPTPSGSTDPANRSGSTLAGPRWAITIIERSVAVLKIMGVILGAPAVASFIESITDDGEVSSGTKTLESQCSRLGEFFESLMEKEVMNTLLEFKNSLHEISKELITVLEELRKNKEDSVALEGASRKIIEVANRMIKDATDRVEDLPRVCAAFNDFTSKNRRRDTCFKGTREALLEEIKDWVVPLKGSTPATKDSVLPMKNCRFYLLSGVAGIGKSTVAQTVAEWAHDLGCLGASFFFSRDEEDRKTAKHLFTSIAYQLCIHDEECALLIGGALQTKAGIDVIKNTKDPMTQLDVLLLKPLRNIKPRSKATAIVVDALDECADDYGELVLQGLMKVVEELEFIKVILTTRPQPHLEPTLGNMGSHRIVYLHKIDEKVVDGDIKRYLEYHLSEKQVGARLGRPWNACDEEIESLVQGAGRLFIIASTAVLFILDKLVRDPPARTKLLQSAFEEGRTPFDSLNDFYTIILRNAVPVGCHLSIVERYQKVVGAILLIQNPLPIETLAKLIGIHSSNIYAVLDNLQSVVFLSGSGDVPLVYHKSFPEYVMDGTRCTDKHLHIVPEGHHTRLSINCLEIMNRCLKHNVLGLGDPARYFDNNEALEEEGQTENDVQQAIPPELQYAIVHWANHMKHADPEDNALMEVLKKFSEEHLLHWFEALSWICLLQTVHVSLDVVLKFQIVDSDMCQIFSDAVRFISRHYHRIERSALYTYHSALPFTPTESLLYKTFKKEMFHDLCQVEGGPVHWDALIATPQHGTTGCRVMFSANSSQLTSWDSYATKVWNATTGTLVRAFHGGKAALASDFSVAALSLDSQVMVYRVSSGAPTASFDPPATVIELALSFDGSWLAAGLQNGTVSIWDVGKRELIASLDDYDPPTLPLLGLPWDRRRLAFSPSGYALALTTSSGINLWNGRVVARLERESEKPVELAFSSDGTRLASLAENNGVCCLELWNGENGDFVSVAMNVGGEMEISADGSLIATGGGLKAVQVWSGNCLSPIDTIPINWIDSLAFSGDVLAIASPGKVTLYDVRSHVSIAVLQIHRPNSLALSPDGARLATGNFFGAVDLWDVQSVKASTPTSEPQQAYVSSLAFSTDCSRLACGLRDGAVELWDTVHAGKMIARHKLHPGPVNAFKFSSDGNELASGAGDVRFWDGRDGTPTGILEYSFPSPLRSIALSSSLLAAAAKGVITLWDVQSRHLIHTISQDCDSLSLSLNGSMLVFAGNNDNSTSCVTLWDTETCAPTTTFNFDSYVQDLFLSPDGWKFAIQTSDTLKFFDILNKIPIESLEYNGFSWVPHLNGIPISWTWDAEHWGRLMGRFSSRHDRVPVLWIPRDFSMSCFAGRPSIFAFGSYDGRILLIRPATDNS